MILEENKGMFALPGFDLIQYEGFKRFINQGLMEELLKFPKIQDADQEVEFLLVGDQYKLREPSIKEKDAVYKCVTYSSELYVPARLTQKRNRRIREQILFMGSIPLMTSQGTFIINGVTRVLVNQIVRSPGIFYSREPDHKRIPLYTGTIISNWGGRFKLEIDGRMRIWARISKERKFSIITLLLALGLTRKDILNGVCYPNILLDLWKRQDKDIKSSEDAIIELYKNLYCVSGDVTFSESIRKELQRKLFKQRFELGQIGRRNPNNKLNLNVPENESFLLPQDLLAAIDYLIGIKYGIGTLDDIDHLKNRRVRSVANFLQGQLRLALTHLENSIRQTMHKAIKRKRSLTPKGLVISTPLLTTFKEFFGSHPLSQFLDQTNPLAEMIHKRRLSTLGPGGLTRRTASFQVRDIHPSYYGRICPIETSEGINAGLITSLALHARVNDYGYLHSSFYNISDDEEHIVYLSPAEDEYYRIATGNQLASNWGTQEKQVTLARYRQEFLTIAWEQVHFRSLFPLQYFSIGASLIPFLEHNDANRALMGSHMQRQAVPLLKPEKCIVGTGLEGQVALDSGSVTRSTQEGQIVYVDGAKITLSLNDNETIDTELITYKRSNNKTCIKERPIISTGTYLKEGQLLADGTATVGGELAPGRNILVAYMPWEGYNFEDAILISERLISEDIFTSLHIERYEIEVRITNQGIEEITKDIPHLDSYVLRHLDSNGLVVLGSWVETGDVLVGKLTPQEDSLRAPEGKLLQAIFGIQVADTKESCLKVPIGGQGRVIDARWVYKENILINNAKTIHIYILQKRKIRVGDKVAGRHGNKGIVSKILPRQDMPHLQDGTPVDMILSPLGVPSRMNVGQIFECLLGLAGDFMQRHYRITPFDERFEREASRKLVFSELCEASEKTRNPWLFEPDYPGKSRLIDGRTGDTFEQPVTVGKAYMMKLIHQVDDKIHARSSGPYALITQQPLRGRSRRGGQRVGEMEVWALESFGAAYILQEMLTLKSDHIQARYKVLGAIVTGKPIPKPNSVPESFRLLVRELRSLALNLNYFLISEKDLEREMKNV
uniref:DNA-directed RNA polymerase subunit beta n=2 Tax=Psilotum nudum TaxID=3240 RepID=RPOB_PSINU|nr:RNA polymerase beta subunit [Psilotum nudum]Q8WI24.1 RecName: Full=DNA-directed RNA polymerase subunit beta; AltName: Full=PEP; AltName: Full=Plastid-encoded RNA polymerase subunit beta; Short=RNA polymerase subunit beta [Psilotum nudum]AGC26785.1 DNA-directed RNA polymerase subunit beta [Psilotum nudum]BAB84208.1 RNA polymerase subunit beta [Psilotum nudum]